MPGAKAMNDLCGRASRKGRRDVERAFSGSPSSSSADVLTLAMQSWHGQPVDAGERRMSNDRDTEIGQGQPRRHPPLMLTLN